ncbi:MAG: site-specific integrase [Bacteroidetes bacterium]|nr:site-specific integrase [Bacteroidota bacterium]
MATVYFTERARINGKSYDLFYKDPYSGKKKRYQTYRKKKDVLKSENELRSLLDSGRMPESRAQLINLKTFREIALLLQEEWKLQLQSKILKEKTVNDYKIFLSQVNQVFGDKLLCKISSQDILEYRSKIADKLSNVSSNKRLSMIKKVFALGLKIHATTENPSASIKKLSEQGHERNRYMLPTELDSLISAAKTTKSKYYLPCLIYLGAEHGASKQEALSLHWSDINFEFDGKGLIRFFRTKNNNERTAFLMPRTKKALLEWKHHQTRMRKLKNISANGSDIVFSHLDGSQISNFNRGWWSALEKAGIKDFHFHDLRHTFCSNLILSGAGLKEVKEMIGHRDISMTDRYSHLTLKHKSLKQEKLAEYYDQPS